MVGAVRIAEPRAPEGGCENHRRQQKKHSRNLKPQNATHAAKRAQKPADPGGHSLADSRRSLRRYRSGSPCSICRDSLRLCNRLISGRLRPGCQPLAGDASGNAEPDAQSPADGLRSHPVYDGSSVRTSRCFGTAR